MPQHLTIAKMAREVFEDEKAAMIWLRTPNRIFHGIAPMDYLDNESDAAAVLQVLNAIATGGAAGDFENANGAPSLRIDA